MGKLTSKARQRTCSETTEDLCASPKMETALPRTAQTGRAARAGRREDEACAPREHGPKVYGIRAQSERRHSTEETHSRGTRENRKTDPSPVFDAGLLGGRHQHTRTQSVCGREAKSADPDPSNCTSLALGELTRKYLEDPLEEKPLLDQKRRKRLKAGSGGAPITAPSRSLQVAETTAAKAAG